MERILISEIKLACFRDSFVSKRCEVLQNQSANDDIDRRVWPGIRPFAIKRGKDMLIDPGKNVIRKCLAQDLSSICCFLVERKASLSKREIC